MRMKFTHANLKLDQLAFKDKLKKENKLTEIKISFFSIVVES
jgi:hypothetical protein